MANIIESWVILDRCHWKKNAKEFLPSRFCDRALNFCFSPIAPKLHSLFHRYSQSYTFSCQEIPHLITIFLSILYSYSCWKRGLHLLVAHRLSLLVPTNLLLCHDHFRIPFLALNILEFHKNLPLLHRLLAFLQDHNR